MHMMYRCIHPRRPRVVQGHGKHCQDYPYVHVVWSGPLCCWDTQQYPGCHHCPLTPPQPLRRTGFVSRAWCFFLRSSSFTVLQLKMPHCRFCSRWPLVRRQRNLSFLQSRQSTPLTLNYAVWPEWQRDLCPVKQFSWLRMEGSHLSIPVIPGSHEPMINHLGLMGRPWM